MTVMEMLEKNTEIILRDALEGLMRSHLEHYEKAGSSLVEERLRNLFHLTVLSMKNRRLSYINEYTENLASERFSSGYDLREIQIAINTLEEAIWKAIVKELKPAELAEALGLASTVLGSAKDTLAQTYVSLASKTKVSSLDLKKLIS